MHMGSSDQLSPCVPPAASVASCAADSGTCSRHHAQTRKPGAPAQTRREHQKWGTVSVAVLLKQCFVATIFDRLQHQLSLAS
eukprot:scaffold4808_cov19-Tisochrysis_lutea.AAC.3